MATGKPLKSTHGRQLLNLVSDLAIASFDGRTTRPDFPQVLEQIQDINSKDIVASRLADAETGNNAFHLAVSKSRLAPDMMIEMLKLIAANGSEGLKKANKEGDLPLHLYLLQRTVSADVVQCLVSLSPASASMVNSQGIIPLFLCTMRDDISTEVVKVLCKAFPAGPQTANATNSLPIHFAAKKLRPNKEILKILLRRHPAGPTCMNDHGQLPIHCAAGTAEDLEAVQMIVEAHPMAVLIPDRLGRLPLHLAVLAIGNAHTQALQDENEEIMLQKRMEQLSLQKKGGEEDDFDMDDAGHDDDNEDKANQSTAPTWPMQERGQRSRRVVHYLARFCPITLCVRNNFEAVPVDTVLSKVKPERSKRKIVAVYGLYDDPVTARWLLILHRETLRSHWAIYGSLQSLRKEDGGEVHTAPKSHDLCDMAAKKMPPMSGKHIEELQELNWLARRPALLASYQGYSHQLLKCPSIFTAAVATATNSKKSAPTAKSKGSALSSASAAAPTTFGGNEEGYVHPHNLIGRLRNMGFSDLVPYVMQYI
jgi:hypothetical protein